MPPARYNPDMSKTIGPGEGDALVIVDVQRDFLPGGALAVPAGNQIMPILNHALAHFDAHGLPVVATRDWHPAEHGSFAAQRGKWPPHCIQGTPGAEFSPELTLPADAIVISKGTDLRDEGYSALRETNLEALLRERQV